MSFAKLIISVAITIQGCFLRASCQLLPAPLVALYCLLCARTCAALQAEGHMPHPSSRVPCCKEQNSVETQYFSITRTEPRWESQHVNGDERGHVVLAWAEGRGTGAPRRAAHNSCVLEGDSGTTGQGRTAQKVLRSHLHVGLRSRTAVWKELFLAWIGVRAGPWRSPRGPSCVGQLRRGSCCLLARILAVPGLLRSPSENFLLALRPTRPYLVCFGITVIVTTVTTVW